MPNYILKNVVWMDDNINDILHIEDDDNINDILHIE